MNNKNKAVLISMLLIATITTSYAAIKASSIVDKPNKVKYIEHISKMPEDIREKKEKHLTKVREDIKKSFNINENDYKLITLIDMQALSNGGIVENDDKTFHEKAANVIDEATTNLPIGSIMPMIFINSKTLVFTYKDKDGTNIMKKYEFENGSFMKVDEQSKASKIIKIE